MTNIVPFRTRTLSPEAAFASAEQKAVVVVAGAGLMDTVRVGAFSVREDARKLSSSSILPCSMRESSRACCGRARATDL